MLVAEIMNTVEQIDKSIHFKNLIFYDKGPTGNITFNNSLDAANVFDEIMSNKTKLDNVEKNRMQVKSKLSNTIIEGRISFKKNSEKKLRIFTMRKARSSNFINIVLQ